MFYWTLLKVQQFNYVEANEVLADALIAVDTVKSVSNNALTEILKDDLSYNPKTHSYHIISDGKTSVEPVHQSFVKND
jgi:hypothetical protein